VNRRRVATAGRSSRTPPARVIHEDDDPRGSACRSDQGTRRAVCSRRDDFDLVGRRCGEPARGRDGPERLLRHGRGGDFVLLLLLEHREGHHRDAAADGDAHADEGPEGDDGESGVDLLRGRHRAVS